MEPPLPASIIAGMARAAVRHVPVRLTPMTVSHCSSVSSQSRPQPKHSGVGHQDVKPAELFNAVGDELLQRSVVADVHLAGQNLAALGLYQADGLARSSGVAGA